MKLKHIKLFENFQESELDKNMVFDWMPYDSKISDPIQETMPKSISLPELTEWSKNIISEGRENEVKESGLFISHYKANNNGFNRAIVTSFDPIMVDLAIFNSNYEKINEYKDVEVSTVGEVTKGSNLLRSFGISSLDDE
jgi:hypothetical protein